MAPREFDKDNKRKLQTSSVSFLVPFLSGLVVCLASLLGGYFLLFSYTNDDKVEYRRLMIASNPALEGADEQSAYTAKQKRDGIQKDFSYIRQGQFLQMRLVSQEAELVLEKNPDATTQIVEEMRGIKAYVQEECYYLLPDGSEGVASADGCIVRKGDSVDAAECFSSKDSRVRPIQIVRYLEADSGSYAYKNDECSLQKVTVEQYVLPGHQLREDLANGTLILKGMAETMEFSMSGGDPHLKAHRFKATLFSSEGLP